MHVWHDDALHEIWDDECAIISFILGKCAINYINKNDAE